MPMKVHHLVVDHQADGMTAEIGKVDSRWCAVAGKMAGGSNLLDQRALRQEFRHGQGPGIVLPKTTAPVEDRMAWLAAGDVSPSGSK